MLEIQKQFINYNRSFRSQAIKYIVIHSTGNTNDTAQNNHDYFARCNRGSSADFFVDDNNIIQIIDLITTTAGIVAMVKVLMVFPIVIL